MAGKSPKLKTLNASKLKVAVVSASWHPEICSSLIDGAKRALAVNKVNKVSYHEVSGSFELPLAAQKLFDSGIDAVVVLGLILKGDTPHFDYVCKLVTDGVLQLNLSLDVPVIFGVLTVLNEQQLNERIGGKHGHKGKEAAIAAMKMIALNRKLR